MEIDLRQLAFATLWKKYEKKINTEETKEAIRSGKATYRFADYGLPKLGNSPKTHYEKDGEEIELDTAKIIKDYCETNGIDIIKENRENYKVEIVPSEKAIKEFNKMVKELENSQYKNIAKMASKVKLA